MPGETVTEELYVRASDPECRGPRVDRAARHPFTQHTDVDVAGGAGCLELLFRRDSASTALTGGRSSGAATRMHHAWYVAPPTDRLATWSTRSNVGGCRR